MFDPIFLERKFYSKRIYICLFIDEYQSLSLSPSIYERAFVSSWKLAFKVDRGRIQGSRKTARSRTSRSLSTSFAGRETGSHGRRNAMRREERAMQRTRILLFRGYSRNDVWTASTGKLVPKTLRQNFFGQITSSSEFFFRKRKIKRFAGKFDR